MIQEMLKKIADAISALADKNALIKKQAEQIEELRAQLTEKEELIDSLNSEILAKDEIIASNEEKVATNLAELNSAIDELKALL